MRRILFGLCLLAGCGGRRDGVIHDLDVEYARGLTVDVIRPVTARQTPGVILIHGGGWASGSSRDFRDLAEGLARRGYVAFAPNYRLVHGDQNRFPAQVEDLEACLRWMRSNADRFGLDPRRVAAIGASAGGHLAGLLGTGKPQVKCVVDLFGPMDLTGVFPAESQPLVQSFLGTYGARDASPLFRIGPGTVPFLVIQGDRDQLVPVDQSRRFAAALREAQIPVEYIELPGEGHGFSPAASKRFVDETISFLRKYL